MADIANYCKGVCHRYRAPVQRYRKGIKRCNRPCDIYVTWDGLHCPCCNGRLRSRGRNNRTRHNRWEREGINRID